MINGRDGNETKYKTDVDEIILSLMLMLKRFVGWAWLGIPRVAPEEQEPRW